MGNHHNQFDRALAFATTAHSGQTYNGSHYIEHPIRVANQLPQDDETTRIVAILHDTVEDTTVTMQQIQQEFGAEIAADVDALTKRKGEDYMDYIGRVATRPRAKVVKIADLRDNLYHCQIADDVSKLAARMLRYEKALTFLEDQHVA